MNFVNVNYLCPLALCMLGALCGCTNLTIAKPFEWPGLNIHQKRLVDSSNQSVVLVITHAVLIGSQRKNFDRGAEQVISKLATQPGLVGYSVRSRIFGNEVWTASIWVNEEAVINFLQSPEHIAAVQNGTSALKSVQYHRAIIPVSDLPLNWPRILAELENAPPMHSSLQSE